MGILDSIIINPFARIVILKVGNLYQQATFVKLKRLSYFSVSFPLAFLFCFAE